MKDVPLLPLTVSVPGDGFCGLHACLAHTLIAYGALRDPVLQDGLRSAQSALSLLRSRVYAIGEHFTFQSDRSLCDDYLAVFSDFPLWQEHVRDQLMAPSGTSRGMVIERFEEHAGVLDGLYRESSAENPVQENAFFSAWAQRYGAGFQEALTESLQSFMNGTIHGSYRSAGSSYHRLFSSFCDTYHASEARVLEQGLQQQNFGDGSSRHDGFYFESLHCFFVNHGFNRAAPSRFWLQNNDICLINNLVMPGCNFGMLGLRVVNPSAVHWEVSVDGAFQQVAPSLPWSQLQQRGYNDCSVSFSLLPLSSSMALFTEAIQDFVVKRVSDESIWETSRKMVALSYAISRLQEEANLFNTAYRSGSIEFQYDEVAELSSCLEKMSFVIDSLEQHRNSLQKKYDNINILLKMCMFIRDTLCNMVGDINGSIKKDQLPSPAHARLISCY